MKFYKYPTRLVLSPYPTCFFFKNNGHQKKKPRPGRWKHISGYLRVKAGVRNGFELRPTMMMMMVMMVMIDSYDTGDWCIVSSTFWPSAVAGREALLQVLTTKFAMLTKARMDHILRPQICTWGRWRSISAPFEGVEALPFRGCLFAHRGTKQDIFWGPGRALWCWNDVVVWWWW